MVARHLFLPNHIHPEDHQMEEAKLLSVPISPGHNFTKSQSLSDPQAIEEMRCIPYREAVGVDILNETANRRLG